MVSVASPIDDDGNLNFGENEGLYIPVSSRDENGDVIDIGTIAMFFNVEGIPSLRLPLLSDPSLGTGRLLQVTPAQLSQVDYGGRKYSITDESGQVPIILAEGVIFRRNPSDASGTDFPADGDSEPQYNFD